jgi:hypothetical protein
MTSFKTNVGHPRPARGIARRFAGALVCVLSAASVQAEVAIHQVTVPLAGPTEVDRGAAFAEALRVVAVRASGRRDAGTSPRIAAAAADPTPYVQQYSTTPDRQLKVGFDGRALEQLLQQAGLPLWPAERPTTTVLLFTTTVAGGQRAVTAAERPAERVELERAAQVRGVPLAWPSEVVDAATARSQVAGAGATRAYLMGTGGGSGIEWSFGHAGQLVRGAGAPAAGLDLAADELAARYAPGSTRGTNRVDLRVGGLEGVRSYAALTHYLEDLSLVRSVSVGELVGDGVRLDLAVRGDLELLRRIFALDTHLVPAPRSAAGSPQGPDFLWEP